MRPVKLLLPVLLCNICAVTAQSPVPGTAAAEPATIEGRVRDAANGTVLGGTDILVYKEDSNEAPLLVTTDAAGHFLAPDLVAGRYRLVAQRNGYLKQQYGERARNRTGIVLSVFPAQHLTDIDFHLLRSGVITGHVFGEGNDLHVGTVVAALSVHYINSQQKLAIDAFTRTNDLGEYRLYALAPGRYFLAAFEPNRFGSVRLPKNAPPLQRYGISFYPNASEPARASIVTIEPGSELNGFEIYLVRHRTFHIRGRIIVPTRNAQNALVRLEPLLLGTNINVGGQEVTPDYRGIFEFSGVLPGQYLVSATFSFSGKQYGGWQSIELDDSDVDNFLLVPNTGIALQCRAQITDRKNTDLQSINVKFRPTYTAGAPVEHPSSDGTFTAYLSSDIYHLEVSGLPQDAYVESTRLLDQEVNGQTLDLSKFSSSAGRLELTINPNGGHLDGTVENQTHEPLSAATVLLIPDAAHRKMFQLYRATTTDRKGHFTLRGIAPGDYKLLAWEDIEPGAWQDQDFLSGLEDRAVPVAIAANATETRTLTALPAATQ